MANVKRFDAGDEILLSGVARDEVDAAMQDLLARGARIKTPLSQVGTRWVAACSPPPKLHPADNTSTLHMRELLAAQRMRRPEAALCQVEEAGLKRIITGPTLDAVHARLAEFLEGGAMPVSNPEESYGTWIAVCDISTQKG